MSSGDKLMTPEEAIRNLIDFTEAKRVVSIGTKSEEVYAMQKRAYEICFKIVKNAGNMDIKDGRTIKGTAFTRNKIIKIRYNEDTELPDLLKELRKIPNMEIKERGYIG